MKGAIWKSSVASTLGLVLAAPACAQDTSAEVNGKLEEIVVTAQKREQSMQDVPIAVTAVTKESLQANRIYTVADLGSIAPGLTVKPSIGGNAIPAFTMRGQVSYGVVAGSDKQISVYVDGVYISSPRASIFDLPDVERLEVLRGPQGTLFGRNATAGAISVTTRDPTGEAHIRVKGSYGNRDQYRVQVTADTPQVGPFSAIFSYVRNYRHGDIQNAGAGTVWDRSAAGDYGIRTSPQWLGTVDSNSYFAAVKFEPSDSFKMVYKFDRSDDHGTPEGTALVGWDPKAAGGFVGAYLTALFAGNNVYLDTAAKRPDIVANSWSTPRQQRVFGHSLTTSWQVSESIKVKDILAYRKSAESATGALDGVSGELVNTPAAAFLAGFLGGKPGDRAIIIAAQTQAISKQWSNELQVNYSSEKLQATVGALWFQGDDESGGPAGMQNTMAVGFVPASGVVPLGNDGRYFNKTTSLAAYAQLEYKLTPQLEIVGGARITHDKKTSSFVWDTRNPATGVITSQPTLVPPNYVKTKPNFLIGVNWKPNRDTLVYGKYSTSFVSGGSTAGITYEPETASSFEVGIKADLLDHRLRTNLALFHVDYHHFQAPNSTTSDFAKTIVINTLTPIYGAAIANAVPAALSTFVDDQGNVRAQGVELEVTAVPTRGMTLGGSLAYTDVKFPYVNPIVLAAHNGELAVTARPKWTADLSAAYETQTLFDETTLYFRIDAQYHSSILQNPDQNFGTGAVPQLAVLNKTPGYTVLNGRLALRHLKVGPLDTELAVWAKNMTDRKDVAFALPTPLTLSANFIPARSFGVDLSVEF